MLLAVLKYCADENDSRLSRRTQIIEKVNFLIVISMKYFFRLFIIMHH
jgi:hypothetical protein